ncbi:VanZ family protein [Brevibacillus sedimenti]|uniref:VanZ family protein n=1 Tax=Brevibacillus sedimenti TaxID=2613334 RepID=UPI003964774D|nr:VanZ family protein [Anoxybacillus sediminis]
MGNIIAFCPLGFLIPAIFTKFRKVSKTLLICFISVIGIEVFQFVTMLGFFDVDDIMLNMTGCIIGYLIYGGLRILTRNHSKLEFRN